MLGNLKMSVLEVMEALGNENMARTSKYLRRQAKPEEAIFFYLGHLGRLTKQDKEEVDRVDYDPDQYMLF